MRHGPYQVASPAFAPSVVIPVRLALRPSRKAALYGSRISFSGVSVSASGGPSG
jgi:hypothetical protein